MSLFDKDIITKFPPIDIDPIIFSAHIETTYSFEINMSEMRRIQSHLYMNEYGYVYYVIDVD